MSGTFETLDVPPTLVSFAVTTDDAANVRSPEFKRAGSPVVLLAPKIGADRLPERESLLAVLRRVSELLRSGQAVSAWAVGFGGVAEAVMKMSFGNGFGFRFTESLSMETLFSKQYGAFVLECTETPADGVLIGHVTDTASFVRGDAAVPVSELLRRFENRLEDVYPCNVSQNGPAIPAMKSETGSVPVCRCPSAKPRVLIPVFPGTNCEYDSAKLAADAGAEPEIFVVHNLSAAHIQRSVEEFAEKLRSAQMVFIPGGFSGGDEPDGSGKFITAFFRNAAIREGVTDLLERRDGLMLGVCNGFQALIKLGLIPYGRITDADENSPTLTYNTIGRHQSRIVRTRIVNNRSPWLSGMEIGDVVNVAISHGEGRLIASESVLRALRDQGQIATQYVDLNGQPTLDIHFNPNNSLWAIEGLTSPDGRVFGKMGHSERIGSNLYKNVPGEYDIHLFESAVRYFKG